MDDFEEETLNYFVTQLGKPQKNVLTLQCLTKMCLLKTKICAKQLKTRFWMYKSLPFPRQKWFLVDVAVALVLHGGEGGGLGPRPVVASTES